MLNRGLSHRFKLPKCSPSGGQV